MGQTLYFKIALFVVFFIAATSVSKAVPLRSYKTDGASLVNEELVTGILESILDNNVSVAAIRRLFKNVPSITVCVSITYTITCDEEMG